MSRYDGLIIPRSYSEYLNKTDSATLSQMLQHLTELWSHAVSAGDNKPVTSDAVYEALTDAATIQQALQLPGVLSGAVAAGDNKAVTSNAVADALENKRTINPATSNDFSITKNDEVNFYKFSLDTVSIEGVKLALITYGFYTVPSGTSIIEFLGSGGQRLTVILSHSGVNYFGGIVITFYFPLTYIRYSNGRWD